jgi:hypothetical protein
VKNSSELIRLFVLCLVCFMAITSAKAETIFDKDVEILQSDITGITLRYTPAEASITPFEISPFQRLLITRTAQNGQEGVVEVPMKIIPLAMPLGTNADISILESNYSQQPYVVLAPYFAEKTYSDYKSAYDSQQAKNPKIPNSEPWLMQSGKIRGLNIVRLIIPTARYRINPQEFSLLKSIKIRVNFRGSLKGQLAGSGNPGPVFGRILNRVVANIDVAQNWFELKPYNKTALMATATPFDSATTWIRIELTSEGMYGFTWTLFNIAGVNPLNIDPSQIRVFSAGGKELPTDNSVPRPQLTEIPTEIIGGDDGHFDNGDLIVFYADAVDSWQYNNQFARFQFSRNHYTDKNVFWLTVDGNFSSPPRRFTVADGTPDGAVDASVDTYRAIFHKEQDKEFTTKPNGEIDNFEWYWGQNSDFQTSIQILDMIANSQVTVIARHQLGSPALRVNGNSPILPQSYQTYSTYRTTDFVDGTNTVDLKSNNDFFLDYIDVNYLRWLKIIDGNLIFTQPDTFGTIRYNLTQVGSPYYLLDITNKMNPIKITGGILNGSNLVFDDTVSAISNKRYCFSTLDRLKTPGAVSLYHMDNLRDTVSPQNRADEIIVTYDGFYDQAVRFAQHRQNSYGLATRVAKVSDIYNQFSYGLYDPTAIRDFLKYAYENWQEPAPSIVFLFGDGHYDYRNNLGYNAKNYVPPYENSDYMGDESFIFFGREGYLDSDSNSVPDMFIGRINVKSTQDAEDFIDKTIIYDTSPELGPWRERIIVAADDNLHPEGGAYIYNETYHTIQAEDLTNNHIPGKFETIKIYMIEYLMGPSSEKPEAREALLSAINQGAIILNWIGHGSANLWADEHIFRRLQDLPRMANGDRLPLIFTASCSIGKFDVPNIDCMAEEFMRQNTGRAISVVSATRDVYAWENEQLNNEFFDRLLNYDSSGIGEALYIAQYLASTRTDHQIIGNDRHYMVFGDPAQVLEYPKFDIHMTSAPDSLTALSVDSLSGEVVDNNGNLQSNFNGTVWITVKDGTVIRSVVCRDPINNPVQPPLSASFLAPGSTIFIGPAEAVNGRFTSRFFIPKDVSYGSHGAKILAYGENTVYDAAGVKDSILISGSLSSVQDSIGPTVSLLVDGRPFSPGITMAPSSFVFGADVQDEHGVNITGQLGHGLVVSIDGGQVYDQDVTSYFNYSMGDYKGGRLEVRLPSIPVGEHDISLKVWDNFNNSTMITKRIEVVSTSKLEITDVMNYPNPVKGNQASTAFQYCLNNNVDRVSIKIFTESGKKIKTIDITSPDLIQMDCSQVSWDLLDADGDRLANGVYLYMISAERQNSNGGKEHADATGKLVILR